MLKQDYTRTQSRALRVLDRINLTSEAGSKYVTVAASGNIREPQAHEDRIEETIAIMLARTESCANSSSPRPRSRGCLRGACNSFL